MIGEFSFIDKYLKPLAGEGSLGLVDDAALLPVSEGHDTVVTKDVLCSDVHFRTEDKPDDIAWKALAVNISDLVAMGAWPAHYMLGLALSGDTEEAWLATFTGGLREVQKAYDISLLGGDTTAVQQGIVISVTAFGYVPTGKAVTRSGARAGDTLFVTGSLGTAALGLHALENRNIVDELQMRYWRPRPRTDFVNVLARYASAAADISDGLLADAGHIASASNVAMDIEEKLVPVDPVARSYLKEHPDLQSCIWSGGDDYEIVFTVSPEKLDAFQQYCAVEKLTVSKVGKVISGRNVRLLDQNGQLVEARQTGYEHFSKKESNDE